MQVNPSESEIFKFPQGDTVQSLRKDIADLEEALREANRTSAALTIQLATKRRQLVSLVDAAME